MSTQLKKVFKKSILVLFGLTVILVLHILWVTKPSDNFHAEIQLGRIDFPSVLSDEQSVSALKAIREIEGISIARLNSDKTSLIYGFPTGHLNTHQIGGLFKDKIDFDSKPFYVDLDKSAKGCPVLNKKSLTYRISMVFHNAFR